MRILHILNSSKLSGAENVVADICMMFKDEHEMAYCSKDGIIKQALDDRNVRFIPIENLSTSELKRVIKSYKPDIIHAHDSRATFTASLVSKKIPLISHLHGNHEDMRKITIKSLLYLFSTLKVKAIISVSESCINEYYFKKFINKKNTTLRNVLHFNRIEHLLEKDKNQYEFEFVFLGRFSYPKNPARVAKVASMVLKKLPNVKFGIIGEGELKDEMDKVFSEMNVSDQVVFTGRLSYPYKALKSAKCMLMCSRYEGLPIAALEAMALGIPIISTPVDGMKELILHDKTGYLLNSDEDLAEHTSNVIQDNNLQKQLSKNIANRFHVLNDEISYKEKLKELYISATV